MLSEMSRGTVVSDLRGAQKRALTAESVVELITRSGDAVSHRTLRPNLDPVEIQ